MTIATALQLFDKSLPLGSVESYIQRVNQIPVLTQTEEYELAERLYNEKDLEAAKQLILAHLKFVVRVARGYRGYGLALNDLIQEGNIGLMKAVKRFNPHVGVRLVSFAIHWIKAEIQEFILRNWRIVKVATTKAQRKLFFNLRKMKEKIAWFSHQETEQVAKTLKVNPGVVREMEGRMVAHDVSFDAPLDDEEEHTTAPALYLEDHRYDPARLFEKQEQLEVNEQLHKALEKLDQRSQSILRDRWLAESKATLQELAARYQVSAERVRQLENNAMKKLKSVLTSVV